MRGTKSERRAKGRAARAERPAAPAVPATATVTAMGAQGDGLAVLQRPPAPPLPLFVPYALPGERVEGLLEGDRLTPSQILTPSPERAEPVCRYFGRCGGCLLQHWQSRPYLAWKQGLVEAALRREGLVAPVRPIRDAHGAGRRRAILHARRTGTRTVLGFAERRSHAMVDVADCPVLAAPLRAALPALRAVAEALAPLDKPLDLQATLTETGIDLDVRGSGPLPPMVLMDLAALAEQAGFARLSRHGELILQRTAPVVAMGAARVELPVASFLQATAEGEVVLAALVGEALDGARRIADLFAGAGTFALRLADTARIHAVEGNAAAIAALVKAGRATPGLKRVEGEARDLFRRPLLAPELEAFDAVVIDPPRQGAEAQVRELAAAKIGRLAYVSCNATTFARDARMLVAGGWRLDRVTPVDQFRYSPHVELVATFSR